MSLQDQLASLKSNLEIAERELNLLNSGRKSSAPRLRKSLMDLKKSSHAMRASTTLYAKELPTKTRTKKVVEVVPVEAEAEAEPKKVRKPRKKKEIEEPSE